MTNCIMYPKCHVSNRFLYFSFAFLPNVCWCIHLRHVHAFRNQSNTFPQCLLNYEGVLTKSTEVSAQIVVVSEPWVTLLLQLPGEREIEIEILYCDEEEHREHRRDIHDDCRDN